jgi:hypothetical protein
MGGSNRILTFLDWVIVVAIVALILICGSVLWVLDRRRRWSPRSGLQMGP